MAERKARPKKNQDISSPRKTAQLTRAHQEAFLEVYRKTGNVLRSCEAIGVGRRTVYDWREQDDEFAKDMADAHEDWFDSFEEDLVVRAQKGIDSYVTSMGKVVYVEAVDQEGRVLLDEKGKPRMVPLIERKVSDTLAVLIAKGRRPEVYRERQTVEHTGAAGGAIEIKEVTADHVAHVLALLGQTGNGNPDEGGGEPADPASVRGQAQGQ